MTCIKAKPFKSPLKTNQIKFPDPCSPRPPQWLASFEGNAIARGHPPLSPDCRSHARGQPHHPAAGRGVLHKRACGPPDPGDGPSSTLPGVLPEEPVLPAADGRAPPTALPPLHRYHGESRCPRNVPFARYKLQVAKRILYLPVAP